MKNRGRALLIVLLPILLASCSYVKAPEIWVGVSQQLTYTSSVEAQFRRVDDAILGTYEITGDLNGSGKIEGTIRDGIIIATLEPSTTCRFQLVGTATDTTIRGNFEPDPCPAGYSGTWSLQRQY
ncbi:MAG: hypothetical protein LC667_20300 [Thioalkalivibrio sp.]|nr:hypothetical protein [Thioalkalivibrio sp.]